MKRYGLFRDIFEGTLCPNEQALPRELQKPKRSELLNALIHGQNKGENSYSFLIEIYEVVKQNMMNRYFARAASVLLLAVICFSVFWTELSKASGEAVPFRLVVIGCAFGLGFLTAVLHYQKLSFWEKKRIADFLNPLVEVLWAMAEHQDGGRYKELPTAQLRKILLTVDEKDFRKSVDAMLVGLAFEVRKLESERTDVDTELNEKRARIKQVHGGAVTLHLAETNPKTYFDRAVPASQGATGT